MWVFTIYGFFSVVNTTSYHNKSNGDAFPDNQRIEVRSRYKEHLELLKERFSDEIGNEKIIGYDDPDGKYLNRDYEYRIIIDAEKWVHLGAMLSADVTYPNFKSEVHESCENFPELRGTPYLEQLYAVYNDVQNEERWGMNPGRTIN
jgi:hypothetical protein